MRLIVVLVLASCALADTPYLLTTKEKVNAKRAEMLEDYARGKDSTDRLLLYSAWNDADVRFRKKFLLYVDVRAVGVDANDINHDLIARLRKSIEDAASQILKRFGFELGIYDDLNRVNITAWIVKPRQTGDVYIIDGNLQYTRSLLDRQSRKDIQATLCEQRSLDCTRNKQDIESLTRELCMRSLEGFINQMCDDETVMKVYYELLANGLIEGKFQPK